MERCNELYDEFLDNTTSILNQNGSLYKNLDISEKSDIIIKILLK
jgi:hypothetical protein